MRRLGVILGACAAAAIVAAIAVGAPRDQTVDLAVVGVEARVGGDLVQSTGVVIDADAGLVLTSAHSIWGATELRLATHVGMLHGRIVARAPCTDIALLETQPRIPGLAELGGTTAPVDHPLDVAARGLDGILAHLHRPLPEWASGAPVIDSEGRIAGIAEAARGRRSTVVPWALISERIDELRPDARRIFVGWRDEYGCAPRLHAVTKARHPGFQPIDAVLNAPVPATRLPGTEELDR